LGSAKKADQVLFAGYAPKFRNILARASFLGVLDRHDKDAITLLFAAIPNEQSSEVKQKKGKSRKRAFKNFYLKKLRPLPNISGWPGEALSRKRRRFGLRHINSRPILRTDGSNLLNRDPRTDGNLCSVWQRSC
jgi:hypothetical protein